MKIILLQLVLSAVSSIPKNIDFIDLFKSLHHLPDAIFVTVQRIHASIVPTGSRTTLKGKGT